MGDDFKRESYGSGKLRKAREKAFASGAKWFSKECKKFVPKFKDGVAKVFSKKN